MKEFKELKEAMEIVLKDIDETDTFIRRFANMIEEYFNNSVKGPMINAVVELAREEEE